MRSSIISSLALLLIQSSVLVSAVAIPDPDSNHPLQLRATSQKPMSKADFDKETDQMRKEFHCRLYDKNMNKRHDMTICNLKCGDLAKKTEQTGKVHTTTCTLLDTQHPALYMDPDKDIYKIGKCVCDMPIMNMVGEFTGLVLPMIGEIGCEVLTAAFQVIEKAAEVGSLFIPGVGEASAGAHAATLGTEAAIKAAKTLGKAGKKANDFKNFFKIDNPCGGTAQWTEKLDKLFAPLQKVPDGWHP